jgi:hypothetical protein
MRDRSLISIGVILFLVLATFPFTYNLAARTSSVGPDLKLPENEKQCVAPTEYMISSHMQLLVDWRENRVRRDIREYTAFNGKSYSIDLTGTCLTQCHTAKSEFCDRCHTYMGVGEPYCMECHIDPEKTQGSGK